MCTIIDILLAAPNLLSGLLIGPFRGLAEILVEFCQLSIVSTLSMDVLGKQRYPLIWEGNLLCNYDFVKVIFYLIL